MNCRNPVAAVCNRHAQPKREGHGQATKESLDIGMLQSPVATSGRDAANATALAKETAKETANQISARLPLRWDAKSD